MDRDAGLKVWIDALLLWVSQWMGVTLPLILTVFFGLVICAASATALWTRRIRIAPALLGFLSGAFLVLIGLDTRILHGLVAASHLTRTRLLMGLLSVLVIAVTFEAVRRSRLKERYALLWMFTGAVILLCAFVPSILVLLTTLLGMQYMTAVGFLVLVFFVALLFHVSLALSNLQEDETATAQRCALLEARLDQLSLALGKQGVLPGASCGSGSADLPSLTPAVCEIAVRSVPAHECAHRKLPGYQVGVPLLVAAALIAVLWSGLRAPDAMIGDEVTHYYMLRHQASVLPSATFQSHIPTAWGGTEIRNYPHANLWHYAGAWLYRLHPSFALTQLYQVLFLAQLLWAAFALVRQRNPASTPAILLYVLLLASLPMTLLFSVAFYQDVPVTAQILTSFLLLSRRRWVLASVFLALAIGIKVTAVLFIPAFLVLLAGMSWKASKGSVPRGWLRLLRRVSPVALSCAMLWGTMEVSARLIREKTGASYYPYQQLRVLTGRLSQGLAGRFSRSSQDGKDGGSSTRADTGRLRPVSAYEAQIIANHPGDLRQARNWVLYGGLVLWVVLLAGAFRALYDLPAWRAGMLPSLWPLWVGLSYLVPSALLLRTAPDARFFLPAVPLILLPLVESFSRLPRQRLWMCLLVALAIAQSGMVLSKTMELRQVSPGLMEGIRYLERNPPPHDRVFMYPEGNYRLFPARHEWYLRYRLREFWRGDNDLRIDMLREHRVGAIVIKKNLISPVDENITNLGVYPDTFVRELESDGRFQPVFENPALLIYRIEAGTDEDLL